MTEDAPLLQARNLEKHFEPEMSLMDLAMRREKEPVQAVDGVSLNLERNESQAVIGESGCGKTTLLETLVGLNEPTGGELLYRGRPVSEFDKTDWKDFRRNVQIIFQDPFNSLDPKLTVQDTLMEPLKIHDIGDRDERIRDILREVELNPPEKYMNRRPGQLSGGEKQRVAIARALILEPDVILADEPVSMLDVSTQAAILEMLENLISEFDVSMLYISHDLSTVSYVAETIHVMYLGRIVESAPTERLLDDPMHPYAQALTAAIPIPDPHHDRPRPEVSGSPRDPVGLGEGCRFRDRCPERMDICEETPLSLEIEDQHRVACHLHYDHEARQPGAEQPDRSDGAATGAQPTSAAAEPAPDGRGTSSVDGGEQ